MISFSAKNQTFRNNGDPVLDLKNFFSRRALMTASVFII